MSKTPKFDKALDEIFKTLVPYGRICRECNKKFEVQAEDINFYKMFRVPPPTMCPKCRQIQRFGFLMRVPKFFKRPCVAPGHTEDIVTIFPPSSPHKIYDNHYWYSDSWDPVSYGRSYNFNQKFFDQFRDLFFDVPHLALERDLTSINSEYTLGGRWGKNNYYCGGSFKSEECLFCDDIRFSKSCIDCSKVWNSEFCYACVESDRCSRCVFVVDSVQCLDSAFLYDCKNCTSCFLSANLRNKSYVFENKQLTKEEYQRKIASLNLGDKDIFKNAVRRFEEVFKNALHRSLRLTNSTNCVGDSLSNCSDCFWTFDGNNGQNFRFVETFEKSKDAMDSCYNADNAERIYGVVNGTGSKSVLFGFYVRVSNEIEYSSELTNCQNCFGCVGLKNKKFHIFNKPYSENDYWKLVDEIKFKMLNDGEYGELPPLSLGLFPYQSSKGQQIYPINREEATKRNIPWYDEPESRALKNTNPINSQEVLYCEITGKPFKIVGEELKFYKYMNLPIPTKHPWQRMMERIPFEHPFEIFPFVCPKCGEESFSIYNEEKQKQFKIFCEKCYLKEVV